MEKYGRQTYFVSTLWWQPNGSRPKMTSAGVAKMYQIKEMTVVVQHTMHQCTGS